MNFTIIQARIALKFDVAVPYEDASGADEVTSMMVWYGESHANGVQLKY